MVDDMDPADSEAEASFGARFIDEFKRLGGGMMPFEYAALQEMRRCDREGLISAMRKRQPLSTTYAAMQRIRSVSTPEELAREMMHARQMAAMAISGMGFFAMLALLS